MINNVINRTNDRNLIAEQRKVGLRIMNSQIRLVKQQESDEIPAKFTKIRCVCNKFVIWRYMYRCLYCGIWFCKDCAEEHFGEN